MSIFKDANKILGQATDKKNFQKFETDRNTLLKAVGSDLAKMLEPAFEKAIQSVISRQVINIPPANITVPTPKVSVEAPIVNVPQPKVSVTVPEIKMPEFPRIPDLKWPQGEMNIKGWVGLMGVNLENPLPVQLRDEKGAPLRLFDQLTQVINGGGGGRNYLTISKILASDGTPYSSTNPMPVTITSGGTATTGTNIVDSDGVSYNGSNPLPVTITSGSTATSATNIVDSSGIAYSGSNPIPVVITSGATATTAVQNLNGDGTYRDTFPVSGTVLVSGITNSTGVSLLGSDGLAFGTSKPIPVTMVTGVSASVNASIIDSTGIGYSGSNPIPVYNVAGAASSVVAVGPIASDVADVGHAPIKIGGIARTANPTAVAGGDMVSATFDDNGRQVMRLVQVRDLIATAYVSLTSGSAFGTETTLLAATAGSMFDLIYVMGTNDSDVAAKVDIRGVTAGNILMSLMIPASGTAGIATPVPLPQTTSDTGNAWTVDAADITGTNLTISAQFTREV